MPIVTTEPPAPFDNYTEMRAGFYMMAAHVAPTQRKKLLADARAQHQAFAARLNSANTGEQAVGKLWAPHWHEVCSLLKKAFETVPYSPWQATHS